MHTKKTPTKLGSVAGGKRQGLDFTATTRKNAAVRHGCDTGLFDLKSGSAAVHHHAGAIIRIGAEHTKDEAVAAFAEKKAFSRPEFFVTTGISRSFNGLMGLGASIPQGRRHGFIHVFKPSPTMQSEQLHCGLKSHEGAKTMTKASDLTTPSTGTTHHDHHQAELLTKATNSLALALHQVRNATTSDEIKRAVGAANSAARSLNRWSAYSEKRKEVELVSVKDPRIARYYPETSGGLSAEPDGPWLLAIGRLCTDQQLERFAQREGFAAADLEDEGIDFDGLIRLIDEIAGCGDE